MSMFIDTLATHDWSLPRQNTTFHKLLITTPVTRFIMGISKEFGVEAVWFCPKPFDSNNFGASLTQIRSNHHYPAYLFLDNSSWHTSAATKNNMKRLGFRWIFNAPYHPELQPIELIFGVVKQIYRKLQLQALCDSNNIRQQTLVRRAINQLNKDGVRATCEQLIQAWKQMPAYI